MKKYKKIMAALMAVTTIFTCCMTASATETASTESAASAIMATFFVVMIIAAMLAILHITLKWLGAKKRSILGATIIFFLIVALMVPLIFKLGCVAASFIAMLVFIKKDNGYTENLDDASDDQCPDEDD